MLTVARRLVPDELDLPAPDLMICVLGADVESIEGWQRPSSPRATEPSHIS